MDGARRSRLRAGSSAGKQSPYQSVIHTLMWQDWTNAVLGLCVIAVGFLGLSGATLAWTLGILGLLIAVIGFSGAASGDRSMSHAL